PGENRRGRNGGPAIGSSAGRLVRLDRGTAARRLVAVGSVSDRLAAERRRRRDQWTTELRASRARTRRASATKPTPRTIITGMRTAKIPKSVRPVATAPKGRYSRGSHGYVRWI